MYSSSGFFQLLWSHLIRYNKKNSLTPVIFYSSLHLSRVFEFAQELLNWCVNGLDYSRHNLLWHSFLCLPRLAVLLNHSLNNVVGSDSVVPLSSFVYRVRRHFSLLMINIYNWRTVIAGDALAKGLILFPHLKNGTCWNNTTRADWAR